MQRLLKLALKLLLLLCDAGVDVLLGLLLVHTFDFGSYICEVDFALADSVRSLLRFFKLLLESVLLVDELLHSLLRKCDLGPDLVLFGDCDHLDVARTFLVVLGRDSSRYVEQTVLVVNHYLVEWVLSQLISRRNVVLVEDFVFALTDCGDCNNQPRFVREVLLGETDASLEFVRLQILM